ncbi:porin family protein [Ferrimonas aestuarii]|uniref:Porin family protein n=1 Tax=Ferrimonas aestuarii TaxID=2569539 RepID=A0A4U1BSJ8_9GAMM|nr:porin family protein [Ferrimonas aestuarii]TKB57573.1 porin family protein [Ferrimonas aestuarii]
MKKIITTAVAGLLLSTAAHAAEPQFFIGAGVAWQEDQIDGGVNKDSQSEAWQGRFGVILNDNHRFSGTYSYKEDDFSAAGDDFKLYQNLFLASYDYMHAIDDAGKFNLFAGLSAGVVNNKFDGNANSDFVWGGQVGAEYRITQKWSTELGYRYLDQDYDEPGHRIGGQYQLDTSHQFYLSVDYRF